MRRGFTLMEILVSVLLISIVILGIAKIRERNIEISRYIAGRMQQELSNTLFLKKEFLPYNRREKNAYDLWRGMGIDKLRTRELLRNQKRELIVSEPLPLGEDVLPVRLRAFHLRGAFSSSYYRIFF